jgi:uncharacterized membrane protein
MKTTIGVFTTHATAEKGLQDLRNSDINESDLSYLYMSENGEVKDGQNASKIKGGSAVGATTGAVLGGIAGLVIANGVIPGFGSLIVAGPLAEAFGIVTATAVAGIAVGAVTGGLIGGLTQLGVSTDDVHLYEEHVRKGGVLVIARSNDSGVHHIFVDNGANEIREYSLS